MDWRGLGFLSVDPVSALFCGEPRKEAPTKITDLIGYLQNRFETADPDDTATSDRLAWFSYGYMHAALGATIAPPMPPGSQISATWIDLGKLVLKWNHENDNKAVSFAMVQGPVTKQNL